MKGRFFFIIAFLLSLFVFHRFDIWSAIRNTQVVPIMSVKPKLNVHNFPRPPLLERVPRHLRISWNGTPVVDTKASYWALETTHPPSMGSLQNMSLNAVFLGFFLCSDSKFGLVSLRMLTSLSSILHTAIRSFLFCYLDTSPEQVLAV